MDTINYEILGYTSKIFWHFVRDKYSDVEKKFIANSAIETFNLIFDSTTGKNSLHPDPRNLKYHARQIQKNIQSSKPDSDGSEGMKTVSIKEPRAICFADIPINFLPIHLKNYNGIGIGFKQNNLKDNLEDLKPVDYFPSASDFFEDFYKHEGNEEEIILKRYSKIPTSNTIPIFNEAFDKIYLEREWRTFTEYPFGFDDISMIAARNQREKEEILKNGQIKKMLEHGLAVISLDEIFTERKAEES